VIGGPLLSVRSREKEAAVRIHTSLIATAAAVVLAVPAAAGAATTNHHYVPTVVVSSVYPGTSSVSGNCTVTMIEGHPGNYRCPGSTVRQASPGRCTLTVGLRHLWTYSCPSESTDGLSSVVQGASRGTVPSSCTAIPVSGYFGMFSCPRSAFGGVSATVNAASGGAGSVAVGHGRCGPPLTDRYLSGQRCAL
jgi:hypothetical protein